MLDISDQDIGGARVRRAFSCNMERYVSGHWLTREEVLAIPLANRRALSDANYIEVVPRAPNLPQMERFIVGVDNGKFNVIEGLIVNDKPLSRQEAQSLAHS